MKFLFNFFGRELLNYSSEIFGADFSAENLCDFSSIKDC